MVRVEINVTGTKFEFDRAILNDKPFDRLSHMVFYARKSGLPLEFHLDRSATCFAAILHYYQSGELHIPPGICPGVFRREMEFWEIGDETLAACCLYRYCAFLHEEEVRHVFAKSWASEFDQDDLSATGSCLSTFRVKAWRIIDYRTPSIAAKVYLGVVMFMVLVSIVTLAYSTEPELRRPATKCELLQFMKHTDHKDYHHVLRILGNPDCESPAHDDEPFNIEDYNWTIGDAVDDSKSSRRPRSFYWGTGVPNDANETFTLPITTSSDNTSAANNTTPVILVNISIPVDNSATTIPTNSPHTTSFLNTISSTHKSDVTTGGPNSKAVVGEPYRIKVPRVTFEHPIFPILDIILLAFFLLDKIIRLCFCPSFKVYFRSIINITDACALVAHIVFVIAVFVTKRQGTWIDVLHSIQVIRSLRLIRVVQNTRTWHALSHSFCQSTKDLVIMSVPVFACLSVFACLFFLTESNEVIPSIPTGLYLAVITMTTVGYGDRSPNTGAGQLVSCCCATFGLLLLAITLSLSANTFLSYYNLSFVHNGVMKKRQGLLLNRRESGATTSAICLTKPQEKLLEKQPAIEPDDTEQAMPISASIPNDVSRRSRSHSVYSSIGENMGPAGESVDDNSLHRIYESENDFDGSFITDTDCQSGVKLVQPVEESVNKRMDDL